MLRSLGRLLCKQQDFEEGIRYLERALECGCNQPRLVEELQSARDGNFMDVLTRNPRFEVQVKLGPRPNWRMSADKN